MKMNYSIAHMGDDDGHGRRKGQCEFTIEHLSLQIMRLQKRLSWNTGHRDETRLFRSYASG